MTLPRGASFDYVILPPGPDDAEALAHVHVEAWRDAYKGLLPDAYLERMSEEAHTRRFRRALTYPKRRDVTLAAAGPTGIFAYAAGGPSRRGVEREAQITTLYVLPENQGLGVGRRLFMSTARALALQGARSLLVTVLKENERARVFYEHLGGRAQPERQMQGPAGALWEVPYLWPRIGRLLSL